MAEVFIAIAQGSEGFERPVVVKRLLPHLAALPRFRQMFVDEARIMLSLQHGNIVQILDMGRLDGVPFLALEYVDGRDLRTVLERVRQHGMALPRELMAFVAAEVCRGLDYAHRKRDDQGRPLHIVHRDINPANIFISYEGAVKVGDFGLAKARDNLEQSDAGVIKGKLSYLSPEQAQGQPIDLRSDIFSLGTTLFETTTGQRPFGGDSDVEIVMRVRDGRYTRPSLLDPEYPPALEAIVTRALQPDPRDRYATAAVMGEELQRYLQSAPSRTGDRRLAHFLEELLGQDRRSQSALFRLPPAQALPPVMSSVSHRGSLSDYRHGAPPAGDEEPLAIDPPPVPLPAAGGVGVAAPPAARPPSPPPLPSLARATPPHDRYIGWLAGGVLVAVAGLLLWRALQPAAALDPPRVSDAPRAALRRERRPRATRVPPRAGVASADAAAVAAVAPRDGGKRGEGGEGGEGGEAPQAQDVAPVRPRAAVVAARRPRRPTRGVLEIATTLAGEVYVDGRLAGRTPGFRRELRPGRHSVSVRPSGRQIRHDGLVEIVAGKTQRLTLTAGPTTAAPSKRGAMR